MPLKNLFKDPLEIRRNASRALADSDSRRLGSIRDSAMQELAILQDGHAGTEHDFKEINVKVSVPLSGPDLN